MLSLLAVQRLTLTSLAGLASRVGSARIAACAFRYSFQGVAGDSFLNERAELLLVRLFILIEEAGHVVGNVLTRDVIFVDLGVIFFTLGIVTGETFVAVRDVESSIEGPIEAAEDLGAS